jgi:hypothetical protein
MSGYFAKVECTAVPDGFEQGNGQPILRLSVVLRPEPTVDQAIPLLQWPSKISGLAFEVSFGTDPSNMLPITLGKPLSFNPPDAPTHFDSAADAWWQSIWKSQAELDAYVRMMSTQPAFKDVSIETYGYARLAELVKRRLEIVLEQSMQAVAHDLDVKAVDASKLDLVARRRLADPNDIAVKRHDARLLLKRDIFADLPIGDASSGAVDVDAAAREKALESRLEGMFLAGSRAVVAAYTRQKGTGDLMSPFPPEGPRPNGLSVLAKDPFAERVFGASVTSPTATSLDGSFTPSPAQPFSLARVALAAVDRGHKTEKELKAKARSLRADDPAVAAQSYIAALQAHPSLRKLVRLIVDIAIPLDAIPASIRASGTGFVTVGVKDPAAVTVSGQVASVTKSATSFVLKTTGDSEGWVFEPRPEGSDQSDPATSMVPSLPLEDGVVQLNMHRADSPGNPRFCLESVDALAGLMSLRRSLQETEGSARSGVNNDPALVDDASLRTRGVILLDMQPNIPFEVAQLRRKTPVAPVAGYQIVHAEDLVQGYRVDFVTPDGKVLPAGSRRLEYTALQSLRYAEADRRDEGFVLPAPRTWTDDKGVDHALVSEQLLAWSGANIGLPSRGRHNGKPVDNPHPPSKDVLPGRITYRFSGAKDGALLRQRGLYRVMLRARKINGSSVSLEACKRLVGRHALGDPQGPAGSFRYTPFERAPAPLTLVPPGQKLVPIAAEDKPRDNEPTPETIVVREQDHAALRVLVLPPAGFDLAEQQGQFDPMPKLTGESDLQARSRAKHRKQFGSYRALVHLADGTFPLLGTNPGGDRGAARSFQLQRISPSPPATPHYVDNTLCALGVRLVATKATPPIDDAQAFPDTEISFWGRSAADRAKRGQGFDSDRITPIALKIVSVRKPTSSVRAVEPTTLSSNGHSLILPTVLVEVALGETVELEAWTIRTGEAHAQHPLVVPVMRRGTVSNHAALVETGEANLAALEDGWFKQASRMRIGPLTDLVRFRIESPVDQPLSRPDIGGLGCSRVAEDHWPANADKATSVYEIGAETTYSFGSITIDRKSVDEVWAEAIWYDYTQPIAFSRTARAEDPYAVEQSGIWSFKERIQYGRLFTIPDIPALTKFDNETRAAFERRANQIDLVRDDAGKLRSLSAEFKSHIARLVCVRIVARSRFAPREVPPNEGAYEQASADKVPFEAALEPGAQLPTGVFKFWLLATSKPAAPQPVRNKGVLYRRWIEDVGGQNGLASGKRLSHVYRCWLDSIWFDSGQGEKLAVVCRDPKAADQPDWVLAQLSRWGGAMSMAPSQELRPDNQGDDPTYLDASQIRDGSRDPARTVGQVDAFLPLPEKGDPNVPLGVKLAVLEPQFDEGCGRWFCDIELANASAFLVSAKLSLARYQEHAHPGCHLSDPVLTDAVMLHQPWEFAAVRKGRRVEVIATGPSYIERAPMVDDPDSLTGNLDIPMMAAAPLITVELERLDDRGSGPVPVLGESGDAVTTDSLGKGVRKDYGYGNSRTADVPAGCTRWTIPIDIPSMEVAANLAVRVSLASAHANSKAGVEDNGDGLMVYLPEPLMMQLLV